MKILHIINNLGSGGAEKLLEEYIPILNSGNNIKAEILLLTDVGNVFSDSLERKNVIISTIKYRNKYDLRNIIEIAKFINSNCFDIVHSHIFPTQYWVALAKCFVKNRNVKFVTTEHNTHNRRREMTLLKPIEKYIYSKYDFIISISEKTQINLINWLNIRDRSSDKFQVIENGVSIEKIKQSIPYNKGDLVKDYNDNTKLICMVGRFSEAKDQPTIIRSLINLPSHVHLLLIGEGALKDNCMNLAERLGLSNRVHFLGFRTDVHRILKTVDIVILSSFWEGMSLASIEGLASGKPFVASNVPGLVEIVRNVGIVFNPGDSNELSSIINRLLTNEVDYNFVANRCINESEKYSINIMVEKIIRVYSSLSSNSFSDRLT